MKIVYILMRDRIPPDLDDKADVTLAIFLSRGAFTAATLAHKQTGFCTPFPVMRPFFSDRLSSCEIIPYLKIISYLVL